MAFHILEDAQHAVKILEPAPHVDEPDDSENLRKPQTVVGDDEHTGQDDAPDVVDSATGEIKSIEADMLEFKADRSHVLERIRSGARRTEGRIL